MVFVNGKCTTNGTVDDLLLYSRQSPEWIHGVRVAPDGATVTPAIPSILSPKGGAVFTVDSLKSEIYFYDDAKSSIYKRSLDGGNVTLITKNEKRLQITKTVSGVHSLNLDPSSRLLFYSSTTQLRQHSIQETGCPNPAVLVSFFSFHPLTMALDVSARKVYWLDPFEFTLHRSGYDGEDNEERGVQRATPKADGTFDIQTIDSLPVASQLQLYERRPIPGSKCLENNGGCEQLCFPGSCTTFKKCNDANLKCACASGFTTNEKDPTKCTENPSKEAGKCDEKTQFMCKHTEICIDIGKVCDGRWDCYDGSDEDIRGIC
ncbi:Low-density lipoprotein receptor domain class A, partial [Ostertagia ostertagi]